MQRLLTTKAQRRHFTGIGLALFSFFVITMILQMILPMVMARLYPGYARIPWLYFAVGYLPYYLLAVPYGALILKMNTYGTPPKSKMRFGEFISFLPICIALSYVGNMMGNIINTLISAFTGKPTENALEGLLGASDTLTTVVFVVILAPIVEELLFRKFLVDAMYPYGERVCILMSALLFGAFHGNFYQFFYAVMVGALLTFVYCRTGRIWYTILLHALFNFFGSVVALAVTSLVDARALAEGDITVMLTDNPFGTLVYFAYSFLMLGVAALGVVLLIRKLRKTRLLGGAVKLQKPFVTAILNVGMLLFLSCCIVLFIIGM